jgi:hypothetical protein
MILVTRYGINIVFTLNCTRQYLGPIQPPIQCVPRTLSLEVRRPGREADHLPPSSADVKNRWSYTSTPQHAFMVWRSVKAQGQLYLLSYINIAVNVLCRQLYNCLICVGHDKISKKFFTF